MNLTNNFTREEFLKSRFFNIEEQIRVNNSYLDDINYLEPNLILLANNLQALRDFLNTPISINISYRPKWYELSRGRSGNSQHVKFKAADITTSKYSPNQVADAIELLISQGKMQEGGLGRYNSFTHYDIRNKKSRWDNR